MKGVIAAIVTHFASDLTVDHAGVQAEVNRLLDDGIQGSRPLLARWATTVGRRGVKRRACQGRRRG
jgi:hypothetical protein